MEIQNKIKVKIFPPIIIFCISCCAEAQQVDLPINFGKNSIQIRDGKVIDFSHQFNYNFNFGEYIINYADKITTHDFVWNKFNTIIDIKYVNNKSTFALNTNQVFLNTNLHIDAYMKDGLFISNYSITKNKNTIVWHNSQTNTQENSFELISTDYHSTYDIMSHNFTSTFKQFGYTSINNKSTYLITDKWINLKYNSDELCLGLKNNEFGVLYNQGQTSKVLTLSENKNNFSLVLNWDLENNKFHGFSLNYKVKF
jgi:hypothetical protein